MFEFFTTGQFPDVLYSFHDVICVGFLDVSCTPSAHVQVSFDPDFINKFPVGSTVCIGVTRPRRGVGIFWSGEGRITSTEIPPGMDENCQPRQRLDDLARAGRASQTGPNQQPAR